MLYFHLRRNSIKQCLHFNSEFISIVYGLTSGIIQRWAQVSGFPILIDFNLGSYVEIM